jgi:MoxR-like ATPase
MEPSRPTIRSITLEGRTIHLREPDDVTSRWIGQKEVFRFLISALLKSCPEDHSMFPVLVGNPGAGKTTLASAIAGELNLPVYLINCTSDMRPEDLIVTLVLGENRQGIYQGSALVSAVVNGGICILDEANRMNERTWASLAPLLDGRDYVESVIAGVKIHADPEFRLIATMNNDSSTFGIPGYIESRLKPVLPVNPPTSEELIQIIQANVPFIPEELIKAVVDYLSSPEGKMVAGTFSIRDAIHVTRYAYRLKLPMEKAIQKAVEYVISSTGMLNA